MVMNFGLQKHTVKKLLEKSSIDPATVDLKARLDSTLHLDENIEELEKDLNAELRARQEMEERAMSDEQYRRMLRQQGGGSLVIETIGCSDGWTYQVEMRDCGKDDCNKCPHGPYVYRHKTESSEHRTEYVKRAAIPQEVREKSHELEV